MTIKHSILVVCSVLLLSGCATPDVVTVQQLGDSELSCQQISREYAEAQTFFDRAQEERGFTGTNVLAGLFFWPAIFATYSNIEDAMDAASDRMTYLSGLAEDMECS